MKNKLNFLFLILFISLIQMSYGQREQFYIENSGFLPSWRESSHGNVLIHQDAALRTLVKSHIDTNEDKFPGWRVQIYFGSGQSARQKASSVKKDFYTRYGQTYAAYIVYDSPYFKVRVGDFRTKAEAMKLKESLNRHYKSIWVKKDNINYPDKME